MSRTLIMNVSKIVPNIPANVAFSEFKLWDLGLKTKRVNFLRPFFTLNGDLTLEISYTNIDSYT